MTNRDDENITTYIQPILKSTTPYDLIQSYKYLINLVDPDTGETSEADVINIQDVLSIVMTTQIEATVIFMENLLNDNKIVMMDDLQMSFKQYSQDLRKVIEDPKNFITNGTS